MASIDHDVNYFRENVISNAARRPMHSSFEPRVLIAIEGHKQQQRSWFVSGEVLLFEAAAKNKR
jgi:hypothetical protein